MIKLLERARKVDEISDGTLSVKDEIAARHEANREKMRQRAGEIAVALYDVVGDSGPGILDKDTSNRIHSGEYPVVNIDMKDK